MDWKTINKADSVAYIALAVLGYAIPNIAYRVFLLDFTAELANSVEVDLVRAESTILLFLALCFFNSSRIVSVITPEINGLI